MPTAVGIMAGSYKGGIPSAFLVEPFNNYTANSWALAGTPSISAARTGSGANVTPGGGTLTYTIPAPSRSDTLTIGFAVKPFQTPASNGDIIRFLADAGATTHVSIRLNTDRSITALRGTISSVGSSAINAIPAGSVWYYFEVQTRMHDTLGFVTVRVDGTQVLNLTAQDFKNAGTATVFDTVTLIGGSGFGSPVLFDDLYMKTGAGQVFEGSVSIP